MAYPILYNANETNFEHLGVSVLSDASNCYVTRERNGIYTLEFDYSFNGKDVDKIKEGMIIKCDAGHRARKQRFIVSQITKSKDGYKIYCKHISQVKTAMNALRGDIEVNGSAMNALETWRSNLLDSKAEFFVWSDILTNNKTTWTIDNIENAREALGGKNGSILDVWGGEYEFDNLNIKLHKNMGIDTPTIVAYGKNLLDIEQEESILETYTSIFPFVKYQPESTGENDSSKDRDIVITLPEVVIDSKYASNFTHRRILKVDFSSDDKIRTVEQLRSKANSYIKSNNVGVPKLNLTLTYQDLSKVSSVFGNQALEIVDLCDTLKVYYEDLGIINDNAKVIKVVWDVILEENHELEIGDSRSSFNEATGNKFEELSNQTNILDKRLNQLLAEQEAIFDRYNKEKSKEIEDAVKDGFEKAKANAEVMKHDLLETLESFDDTLKTSLTEFNEKLNNLDGENLNKLKKQIEDTTKIAETTLKMVGTDDSIEYNKNRIDGATEREIPVGTEFIEISHNGDGFEVGKTYTISWEAVCNTHDFYDINLMLSTPLKHPAKVMLIDKRGVYPTGEHSFNVGEREAKILRIYSSEYYVKVVSNWFKEQNIVIPIRSAKTIDVPVEFLGIADSNHDDFEGSWSDNPIYIFDGGGR